MITPQGAFALIYRTLVRHVLFGLFGMLANEVDVSVFACFSLGLVVSFYC